MMKRMIAVLLAMVLLLGTAYADYRRGNPVAMKEDGSIYFSRSGLVWTDGVSVNQLTADTASYLQMKDGDLYFVSSRNAGQFDYEEEYMDTICVLRADGNLEVLAGERRRADEHNYNPDSYGLVESTYHYGYTDMIIYGDHIYFIANDDVPGFYITKTTDWGENNGPMDYETSYQSSAAVYRMNLDGSELTKLISGLGNGGAHMDIANDRIAVASCFRNAVFAYDFSDFMLYDLEGNLIREVRNTSPERHEWIYMEEAEFTVIVNSIQTDGENIYASLGDSEGDFCSSRLVNVDNIDESMVYEAWYVPAMLDGGRTIALVSDEKDTFWSELLAKTTRLSILNGGDEQILAYIPEYWDTFNANVTVDELDRVYLCAEGFLLRVPAQGGVVEILTDAGFVPSDECAPENYFALSQGIMTTEEPVYMLPDSDTRLISREELQGVDQETLALMRNEILARHGYPFQKEKYQDYFGSQSWYQINPDFEYGMLSEIEMKNVETIKKMEEAK